MKESWKWINKNGSRQVLIYQWVQKILPPRKSYQI